MRNAAGHFTEEGWIGRFLDKIDFTESCWLWTATKGGGGYGSFKCKYTSTQVAHRVAYELFIGPIPEGLDLDHLCRMRACVNPNHLEPVTRQENIRRGISSAADNARKTHCKRGHEFTPENTSIKNGWRSCRACHALLERNRRANALLHRTVD